MSASGPCATCRKRCCTNYTVSITGYDAWVIAKGLCLPMESFLIYFPVPAENERGFSLVPGGEKYEIALDKVGIYQQGNPCVFWMELLSGGGRCGIYPYRPLVCQTYPAYQQDELVVLRDDVLCPEGAWNLVGMDLPVFRERLSRFRLEQDLYAYIVAGWNRNLKRRGRAASLMEYYAALMNLYEPLQLWLAALPPEDLGELVRHWGELPIAGPNPLFANLSPAGTDDLWQGGMMALREQLQRAAPWFEPSREAVALVA